MKTLYLTIAGALLLPASAAQARFGQRDPMAAFDDADTNHDGVVSRAEFRAARVARFDRMDRNHDGAISRDDFGRLLKFRPQAGQLLDQMLAEADTNHDGRVTRGELSQAPMPLFDRADTNHDGVVDANELAAARDRLQQLKEIRR
ncbi:EF-hand domain-containing protein [Hephaestia mangrovi]|uniref:EF-hand domain-containing protein n=1 Tax=Hephaestia mangrovi TaxID=2873268 RepID=UPI001CA798DE|nr:EF-hand domain-containing protein [Hephaestia mangrovi]MBY8826521.1 EF-hand domain-containing protein [Hephaestia mangrovi]